MSHQLIPTEHDRARKAVTRSTFITRLFIVVFVVFVLANISFMTINTLQNSHRGKENRQTLLAINQQSNRNHELSLQIREVAQAIKSCTTPAGKCATQGREHTAEAVGTINEVVVAAAYCARQPENYTLSLVKTCVREQLNNHHP